MTTQQGGPAAPVTASDAEGFAAVCAFARLNLRDALDLIAVHAEQPVSGLQPRAALNWAIVVAGISSWERFVADLEGLAASGVIQRGEAGVLVDPYKIGTHVGGSSFHPRETGGRLRKLGYLSSADLIDRWVVDVPTGWKGAYPGAWERLASATKVDWGAEDYLESAILVRNAGAHRASHALAELLARRDLPFLDSDAKSTTIQHGYARGVVALVLQVLDSTIVAICSDKGWSTASRMPPEWFAGKPQGRGRHEGVNFWRRQLPRA
ncbi:hypothetical protein DFJ68_2115 [Terracoccus luteus]|uniref:Uncharacterized protein n=1 Tax=Terracoccus luteus TaxID=53356 RepID=A0A495Y178_9MICO|nr:hypothetical protein [Terracoccus luteus]RKT78666.1 hypothetical protein DFJ68_2115 [Terracoccus luteus]